MNPGQKVVWFALVAILAVFLWWGRYQWQPNTQNSTSKNQLINSALDSAHQALLHEIDQPALWVNLYLNPKALKIVGTPTARQTLLDIIHRKLGDWYVFSIDAEGYLHLQPLPNQELLSKSQRAFLSVFTRMLSIPYTLTLQVYDHHDAASHFVLIGKDLKNAIDVGDMEKFGSDGWLTEQGVMGHELYESYLLQTYSLSTKRDHVATHVLATALEDIINEVPKSDAINRTAAAGKLVILIKTDLESSDFDREVQIWYRQNNVTHLTQNEKWAASEPR